MDDRGFFSETTAIIDFAIRHQDKIVSLLIMIHWVTKVSLLMCTFNNNVKGYYRLLLLTVSKLQWQ